MIDKNTTINSVSPLKRKKSYRGGTKVKKAATATSKRRGGFAKSTATSNKAGYNVQTRFKYTRGQAPASGSPESPAAPAPQKPYSFDKDGNVVVNNYIDVAGGTNENINKNININENINTNNNPDDKTKTSDKYKSGEEYRTIGGKTRESYEQVWERKKDKYMTKGQKSRMGTDKNAYNVFANIDEYIDYMERVKEYRKTKEGKEWTEKNIKSSKERKQKRTWEQKNDEPKVYTPWEDI